MGLPWLNITDILDLVYVNLIEPTLSNWGVISLLTKCNLYLEDLVHQTLRPLCLKYSVIVAVIFTLKFTALIALLVFVRGGIPRYRYDFLTKIGWIKFLSLVLSVFLSTLLLILVI